MDMKIESDLLCLVCNSNIDSNLCTNIFYVCLPHNGEVLANFVLKVLKLSTSDLQSSYVCLRCYNLFGMLEQALWTATNIKGEIFKVFQKKNNEKLAVNITENHISDINEITEDLTRTEKLNEISKSEIIITEHLSKKDSNLLDSNINSIINKSIITNKVKPKDNNESNVMNSDKESKVINYTSSKQSLKTNEVSNEFYKTDTVTFHDNISTFYDEDIKVPETIEQKKDEWQDLEDLPNLQNDAIIDKCINLIKSAETTIPDSSNKSSKSAKVSKYSQKLLKYVCPTCNKMCRTSTELKIHIKSHSSLRPYMCEKCGQAYKHKHALEIHVGMHNGVSPFRCSHCDKCFTQKGALQRHLPMHTGETPYQCELCGKRFVHHTSYNMHTLSHTGQKSYRCQLCNLPLMSTSHLKRHMRVHTGERPYSCDVCGRSFAERYNLLAHQKIHDPLRNSAKAIKREKNKCDQPESNSKKQQFEAYLKQHFKETDNRNWIDQTVSAATQNETDYPLNGADLLESCVNEVWQSLTKGDDERLKTFNDGSNSNEKNATV